MNLLLRSSNTKHTRHAISVVFAYSILLILPGCGIPQLRNPWATRELPETFNGIVNEDNSSQVGIEEFFEDPILVNLINEGLAGNLQLKILAEDIEIANNEVLKRRGAYLPFVTLGAGAGLTKYSSYGDVGASINDDPFANGNTLLPNPLPDFLVAANLSWQLDVWRQLRNARDAAGLRFLGTTEGRNYVVTRLVAEIAENYYELIALDKRIENLNRIIALQEGSLERAKALKIGAQGNELGVQRFQAEVRKNESEKLILTQQIIEVENRINFLSGRYPMPVERSAEFFNLNLHKLSLGVPSDLLRNRPDIRQAELELCAAGLDIKVARANFYPKVMLTGQVGYDAFNPRYLFLTPESLIYNAVGDLVMPLINKKAIQADYMNANARQLQALYDYQRTVLNAFTEVVNRINKVQNYSKSIEIKLQQLESLEAAVVYATQLFQNARVSYMDVLFAQRDLADARMVLIETKKEQLSAIVNTYQALGGPHGGLWPGPNTGGVVVLPDAGATNPAGAVPPGPAPVPAAPAAPADPNAKPAVPDPKAAEADPKPEAQDPKPEVKNDTP